MQILSNMSPLYRRKCIIKNVDELIRLNDYDPIDRFLRIIREEDEVIEELAAKVLFTLKVIDETLCQRFNTSYHFYIKGDEIIYSFLCGIYGEEKITKCDFEKTIFILDFCKLIYRFTCAKKFKEKNYNIFQLRLNSWGREYSEAYIPIMQVESSRIIKSIVLYFENNREKYMTLIKLLLGDLNLENLRAIDRLNSRLNIKLLS
ncbi:hypothetical protein D5274_14540 [bacterium 1XD42-94]|jgi:hypothetical protein|nr:hypothetical protein [bacterium 1XD42-76]NBK06332.1 hypothetical protein [bacterium 1XD42-94]